MAHSSTSPRIRTRGRREGLIVVGESTVEGAIQEAVTRAEKETAEQLDVRPRDIDKTLQQAVKGM
jgi:hypothetical protein